ncbi:MAG: hypothetical protein WAM26_18980 [Nitrososphaeraceae archaeon]
MEYPFIFIPAREEIKKVRLPQESTKHYDRTSIIIINPKEVSLTNTVMNQLSIVRKTAADGNHLPIITHFVEEYVSLGFIILDLGPPKSNEEFAKITDWFSQLLLYAYTKFPNHLKTLITAPIIRFNNEIYSRSPQASRSLKIYMKDFIDGELN